MERIKLFLIMLTALSMSACYFANSRILKSIQSSFTYCYSDKYTGIDTLISINGYYREMFLIKRSPTVGGFLKDTSIYHVDTTYHHFMFYDNGIYVYSIQGNYYDNREKKWVIRDVTSFLNDLSENSETLGAKHFYGNYWGGYIICGDTIKVQSMYQAMSFLDGWHLREDWYKVIDKNTILCINSFNLPTTEISQPVRRKQYSITFVPIPAKPKSDESWILKEKWFWCNEEDWKKHKEQMKK